MADASNIFPLLPSRVLCHIIMRIFEELVEAEDIRAYRLVSCGWRDFIDGQILCNSTYRRRFFQHPPRIPLQKRTAIKKALIDSKPINGFLLMFEKKTLLHSHEYVILQDHWSRWCATCEESERLEEWHLLRKTNVALKYAGSLKTSKPYDRDDLSFTKNGRVLGMCQDHLFYLAPEGPCARGKPLQFLVLYAFKREGGAWKRFQHPARQLWEQHGVEICGLKEVAESQVFLFVFTPAQCLFRAISLSDGKVIVAIVCELPKLPRQPTRNYWRALRGEASDFFDMDAFGLVIRTPSNNIVHFCLESNEETWTTEGSLNEYSLHRSALKKEKRVTLLLQENKFQLLVCVFDNTTGTIRNILKPDRDSLRSDYLFNRDVIITQDGKHALFVGYYSAASDGIALFSVTENKLEWVPVQHLDLCFASGRSRLAIRVDAVIEKSETMVICLLAYYTTRENYDEKRCVALLHLAEPKGVTLLSPDIGHNHILDIVPSDFGYFVVCGDNELVDHKQQVLPYSYKY